MLAPDTFPEPLEHKPLTKLEFAKLAVEQNGRCYNCGDKLRFEKLKIRDEHLHQRATGGGHGLKNRALSCVPCAKLKDTADGLVRKKIRSINKSTKKSQKPKQKIPSRGFQKAPIGYDAWGRK